MMHCSDVINLEIMQYYIILSYTHYKNNLTFPFLLKNTCFLINMEMLSYFYWIQYWIQSGV